MTIDRFHCPIQQTEGFTFDTCISCKWFKATKGEHTTIKCRYNKTRQDSIAFESAFLLNRLQMPWKVEIIRQSEKEQEGPT